MKPTTKLKKTHVFQGLVIQGLALSLMMLGLPAAALAAQSAIWVPSWYAAPAPSGGKADTPAIADMTLRDIVHISAGGDHVRIRLSNAYGKAPLTIDAAALARRASGSAIVAGSSRRLTFGGKPAITIPVGAWVLSDPVALHVAQGSDLAVDVHVAEAEPDTVHVIQRDAVYAARGNVVGAETLTTVAAPANGLWLWLTEVEVSGSPAKSAAKSAIVAFGDSITDGYHQKPDANTAWPDVLAQRLAAAGTPMGVINAGIAGNRLLHDGQWPPFGAAGLARFDRDVLAQPNISSVIVLIGINDIGQVMQGVSDPEYESADAIEAGLTQLALRAHERGLKIYAATLTPFKNTTIKNYYTDDKEAIRVAVNNWIRTQKVFDGVTDFDKAVEDPAHPGQMLPVFDSGDHLHPGAAGEAAMAAAIPLAELR
ncbi:SGNH/GDSL hydrolase family protein [Asticcacaulis sp. EMRT-3]|uniref:SGNH/GDSL hydrolase family protein n=1 Tax=Asticcacaulis sp. EMRT-3 TaxID=3040349 RepID=UPI0024AEBC7C|nr:SGNH/GDSL hydrolase family protein [Asticcacaulis sp. EMRT-3]MDI7776445.1 SGNH/GDSL hydrolase family protein [Asticcacaulis sp. EMRT-3]